MGFAIPDSDTSKGSHFNNQVLMLQKMLALAEASHAEKRLFDIRELAEVLGIEDEKEILRTLYVLEGHKLVEPNPKGDFTSKNWVLTEEGVKMTNNLLKEPVAMNVIKEG